MSKKAKKARKMSQRKKVQKRFKARVAAGKSGLTGGKKGTGAAGKKGSTISNYRASQKKQVQDAAKARNKAFQAARTGLDSKKLGAEATRLTGIPSGDALKPGMLTFSKEGIAQAEANKEAARKEAIRKSMFDPTRANNNMVSFSASYNNPLSSNRYFNLGKNIRVPNEDTASFRKLFKDDISQITRTDKAFKEGATGVKGFRPLKAFTDPNMRATGPTPLARQMATRFLPGALRNISLGSQIFNQGREDSGLTQSLNQVDNVNVGGLSIGFNSPESTDIGAQAGRFFTSIPGKVANLFSGEANAAETTAGGLNIGSTGGVNSGEASTKPSGLARVITGAADKVMRDTTDFDRRGKEKNFLADAFTQTNTALKTIKPYFDAAKGQDDKSIRKQASNLLTDIGSREELAPVARGIKAFTTDNPDVKDGFGRETIADIRDTFTPGKPKMPSIDPKSGIVMSIGNRMLAGDLKNIVKEADQQTGVEKGATRTLGQTFNVGKQIVKNLGDTSTQGYKSAQKIKKLVDTATGKPTPGSLLRGVNPFGRRSGGSNRPVPISRAGGTNPNTLALLPQQQQQQTPAEQFVVPQIPQQQGLDAGNLANVQNQSYQNTFNNLMAINPNYSARFQMRPRRNVRRGNFRSMFSRDYF